MSALSPLTEQLPPSVRSKLSSAQELMGEWAAAAWRVTSKVASIIAKRMPSARVLAATTLAGLSYFASNIWKADIDKDLKKYQGLVERITIFESRFRSMPEARENIRYQAEVIRILRTIRGIADPTLVEGVGDGNSWTILDDMLGRNARASYQNVDEFSNFAKDLPRVIKNYSIHNRSIGMRGETLASQRDYLRNEVRTYIPDKLKRIDDSPPETKIKYGEQFGKIFEDEIERNISAAEQRQTIASFVDDMNELVHIVNNAEWRVVTLYWNDAIGPASRTDFDKTEEVAFEKRKVYAIALIQPFHNMASYSLAHVAATMKEAVNQHLVDPKTATKYWVEKAEIGLYGLSGLIALYGASRTSTPTPSAPPKNPRGQPHLWLRRAVPMGRKTRHQPRQG